MDRREVQAKTARDDDWKISPGSVETSPEAPDQAGMHRAAAAGEGKFMEVVGRGSEVADRRFGNDQGWRLFWKPLGFTLGFCIPGILLVAASFLFAGGAPLHDLAGQSAGLLRLGMIIGGGIMFAIGAPMFHPADWTPQKQEKLEQDRKYFGGKRWN